MLKTITTNMLFAAALSLAPGFAQAQESGSNIDTLFTSPEEREYLDFLRQEFLQQNPQEDFNINEEVPPVPVIDDEADAEPSVTEYRLTGVFTQLNGSRTIWLNGSSIDEAALPANMQLVTLDGITLLRITTDNGSYDLKAGQSLNVSTGETLENWNNQPAAQEAPPATSPEEAEEAEAVNTDSEPTPEQATVNEQLEAIESIVATDVPNSEIPVQTVQVQLNALSELEQLMDATNTSSIAELRQFLESQEGATDASVPQ